MTTPRKPEPREPEPAPPAPAEELPLSEIERLEKESQRLAERAAKARARLVSLTTPQRQAEALHAAVCTLSHEDQCDWYYSSWDKPGGPHSARNRYLDRARKVREAGVGIESAINIYKIVVGVG